MRTRNHMHTFSILAVIVAMIFSNAAWSKPKGTKLQKGAKVQNAEPTLAAPQDDEYVKLVTDLKSTDPEKVIFAVQMLGVTGNPDASRHLIELLKTGPSNDITDLSLQTLGALANPVAVDTLIDYLRHRRSGARVAAIVALEGFTSPKIKNALEQKLRDSNPEVRATAAISLGQKGDASTVPLLFKAFDRGVNEAAEAIGRLGASADALHLTEYLGKVDISTLLPGFSAFLLGTRLDTDTKVKVLNILFDFAGPEVRQFALQMRALMKAEKPEMEYDDPVLKLLSKMVNQIAQD